MKPMHEIVALLEARGCTQPEMASATGYSLNQIRNIRRDAEGYALAVSEYKREIAAKLTDEAADIFSTFNAKIPIMTENLESLALRADKEGVRLKATQDWLDRAPDAPKRVQRQESFEQKSIMLGVRVVDNMKAALADVGATEVLDLIEGEDFTQLIAEPEQPSVVNADDD